MQKINIGNPCTANWNEMTKNADGRFCSSCQTTVIDFSTMPLDEIQNFFKNKEHQKMCGHVHNRQLQSNTNVWYNILNRVEAVFSKTKLRRMAIALVSVLLFLTGCRAKKTRQGNIRYMTKATNPTTQTISAAKKI